MNMSIKELLDSNKLIIPDIQRDYVWSEEQICKLFDSIIRGYPIGALLIWKLSGEQIKNIGIKFYEFLPYFDEFNNINNNPFSNPSADKEYYAVLDGQQRIQSLKLGLRGYINQYIPGKWKNKQESYIKRKLFVNMSKRPSDAEEEKYIFQFLADEELEKDKENFWFEVGKILQYSSPFEITQELYQNEKVINKKLAHEIAELLFDKINKPNQKITWSEIENNTNIDEVLDIFVRTNSGGTVLSKTDLLFSTLVSNWTEAKDKFTSLLDSMNNKGGMGTRFSFSKDFVMRAFMYIMDKPIIMKIADFKDNIANVKENWNKLEKVLLFIPEVLKSFGYSQENIISYNAIMPIIYYYYKDGKDSKEVREEFKKYLVVAQLKKLYGVANNSTLTSVRNCLRKETDNKMYVLKNKEFKFEDLKDIEIVGDRSFKVDDNEVDNWFNYNKGEYTFLILTLLYPHIDMKNNKFHQDHMHPEALLKKMPEFRDIRNRLANLQLLESKENESKNDTELKDWLEDEENGELNRKAAKYLPDEQCCSYEISNYKKFIEERKKIMAKELINMLKI